jgi:hypothetical protein
MISQDDTERGREKGEEIGDALGCCSMSPEGQHKWKMFPIDPQGNRLDAMTAASGYWVGKFFCEFCYVPRPDRDEKRPAADPS